MQILQKRPFKRVALSGLIFGLLLLLPFSTRGQVNLVKYLDYDGYGNPIEVQDATGSVTKFYYGTDVYPFSQNGNGVYLTGIEQVSSVINLKQSAKYDDYGRLIEIKDVNNNTKTTYGYDIFGRLEKVWNDVGELVEDYSYHIEYSGGNYSYSNTNYIKTRQYTDTQILESYEYFDGLGRTIQTQQRGGGKTITSGVQYNERGFEAAVTKPIESTHSNYITNLFGGTGDFTTTALALGDGTPVEDYYSELVGSTDAQYAYSYTEYEKSPLGRVVKSTIPGSDHIWTNGDSGNETVVSYGLNETENFTINGKEWDVNTLQKTITRDPDNYETITYTDGWGQTIVSGVNMNPGSDNILSKSSSDLVTYFEYDLLGNLVRVEDPKGLITTYDYDSFGNLKSKSLPDQDDSYETRFDSEGKLRFFKDPNIKEVSTYCYFNQYDELNRLLRTGRYQRSNCPEFNDIDDINDPSLPNGYRYSFISYYYDGTNAHPSLNGKNLKGRISKIQYKDLNTGNWGGETYYGYTEEGLLSDVIQVIPGLTDEFAISYTYDRLERVTEVHFSSDNPGENFYFWYDYDDLGRLQYIWSDDTGPKTSAQIEAEYTYYADGQVKQLILGDGVQSVDYQYTVQGWLRVINHLANIGNDKFGLSLNHELNGNIGQQAWRQIGAENTNNQGYEYTYDDANRLIESSFLGCCTAEAYDTGYEYDENGNIEGISRNNENGQVYEPYYYPDDSPYVGRYVSVIEGTSNRILALNDTSGRGYDYLYDANGNVIVNEVQGITGVTYDWRNLPIELHADGETIYYVYDADGNRVKKEVVSGATIYYIRGADGEVIAAHDGTQILYWNLPNGIGRVNNY